MEVANREEPTMQFKYFNATWQTPIEDAKKQYHKLVLKYHPDRGGSEEVMVQVNAEWDWLRKHNYNIHRDMEGQVYTDERQDVPDEVTEKYSALINALIRLDGVGIEICGSFIWLSGDTYRWKDALKALGFKWSRNKKMWYMSPTKRRGRNNNWSIERIRAAHGSYVVTEGEEASNGARLLRAAQKKGARYASQAV